MVTRVIDNDVSLKFAGLQKGVLPQAAIRRRLEMVFTPKLRLAGGTYTVRGFERRYTYRQPANNAAIENLKGLVSL